MRARVSVLFWLFTIGGVLGWFIDTGYRALAGGLDGGYFSHFSGFTIPFLPVYGFGLIVVYLLGSLRMNLLSRFLLLATVLTILELFAGVFVRSTTGAVLWRYDNVLGVIDATQFSFWGTLGMLAHLVVENGE